MHQPRVGRCATTFGRHRGVDRHSLQFLATDGASLVRHRQTFLGQRDELLLADRRRQRVDIRSTGDRWDELNSPPK
jgi:hypothetical protein